MGDIENAQRAIVKAIGEAVEELGRDSSALMVATPGGRFQVRWDEGGSATALGQLVFFAEFLHVSGLFSRWVETCPMNYTSPNAPTVEDVLGTLLLSILDGQRRYAHVAGMRGDAVMQELLGMTKIISDDSLRRALAHLAPTVVGRYDEAELAARQAQLDRGLAWMDEQVFESVQEALSTPWILDVDPTIKPLYGHQDGAEIGYNPRKPGRPSHVIHTYWISAVRLVLHTEVQNGKAHSGTHSLPGLRSLLERLTPAQRPQLVRGDCGLGNENVMRELEGFEQAYLFKLRQTAGAKRMIERQWSRMDWQPVGQGWEAVEDQLKLQGWSQTRRVVVLRRAAKGDLLAAAKKTRRKAATPGQQMLQFVDDNSPLTIWEYAVLVTNTDYDLAAIAQLYRDRADCENGFDELKNQWGWGGYTTHDLERCNLSARAVALIYNWWSWYVRLANPKARLEAITSRPLLLSAVGRLTHHAGQSRLLLTLTHAASDQIKSMIANIRAGLQHILAAAPQLPKPFRWKALVAYIVAKILAAKSPNSRSHSATTPAQLVLNTG
jgi:Transposase DDE domain group 1